MGIVYNTDTAVPQDFQIANDENTAYMNENEIYGRSSDIESTGVTHTHTHTWAADGTQDKTTYLAEDMIITGLFYYVPATYSCAIYIDGLRFNVNAPVVGDEIRIPNWEVKEGTPIRTVFPYPAGTATAIGITIVGRK